MSPQTIVCVDVETTGLSCIENEIIEIGAVKLVDGIITDQYISFVKPKGRIDTFVSELTGIHAGMLVDAPAFADIYKEFLTFLGDSLFVAHNVQFDYDMINHALARIGQPCLTNDLLDTQELTTILYPHIYSHKLSSLARHFKWTTDTYHRALHDALSVASLFLQIEKDIRQLNPLILSEGAKLIGDEKRGLKHYIQSVFSEVYKGESLHYKDYLSAYKKSPAKKQESKLPNESIADFFSTSSKLKTEFQQFEVRSSQQKMAEFIDRCFQKSEHGIVEAGTGTGKSLAYLIPAIFWTNKHNTPIVISTNTKNLQNQLVYNDLPKLFSIMPFFSYCVVKGKENYIDIEKFEAMYRSYSLFLLKRDVVEFLGLLSWILKTQTGDLSELHPNIYSRFYQLVHFTGFSESTAKRKLKEKCFVTKMRKKAKESNIIITNHALVFSDLISGAGILPEYQYLIVDEAHHLEEAATSSFSVEFNNFSSAEVIQFFIGKKQRAYFETIALLISSIPLAKEKLITVLADVEALKDAQWVFFEQVAQLLSVYQGNAKEGAKQQIRISPLVLENPAWQELTRVLQPITQLISKLCETLRSMNELLKDQSLPDLQDFAFKLTYISRLLNTLEDNLNFIFSENPQYVRWIESDKVNNRIHYSLIAAPIDCSVPLSDRLFNKKRSIIATSATLTIKNTFQYFIDQIGLAKSERPYQTCLLPSDYNYKEQANFYIIKDLPSFLENKEGNEKMAHLIAQTIKSRDGGVLVLFTSYKTLRGVYYSLKEFLKSSGISIYSQHLHGSRESMIERFKNDPSRSILLGVDSFWEGVDIPGNALNCVIMQKLPFAVPSDPLHSARMEHLELSGGNGFMSYLLPLAILKFKQGIGRLIRSKYDTGSIVVLDNRLFTKSYGKYFLDEVLHYNLVEANSQSL